MQEQKRSQRFFSGIEVDMEQTPIQRITKYLGNTDNPATLKIEDYEILFEWSDTQQTLQECFTKALHRGCTG